MAFRIMSDGLVYSVHDTADEAEQELAKVRADSAQEIERLENEIESARDFAAELSIQEVGV